MVLSKLTQVLNHALQVVTLLSKPAQKCHFLIGQTFKPLGFVKVRIVFEREELQSVRYHFEKLLEVYYTHFSVAYGLNLCLGLLNGIDLFFCEIEVL
jgi:hypothetical protein